MRDISDILDIIGLVDMVQSTQDLTSFTAQSPAASGGARSSITRRRHIVDRMDPFELPDEEFIARYRFSKDGVRQLTDLLRPQLEGGGEGPSGEEGVRSQRGRPYTPERIVCSGLDILGGGRFKRMKGLSPNPSATAHRSLYRFVAAVNTLREEFIKMPGGSRWEENARHIWEMFRLRDIACGIDGCHIPFDTKPRGLREGMNADQFKNSNGFYSLNTLVTGGPDKLIYNLVADTPGSQPDCEVFESAAVRSYLEARVQGQFTCLADSGFRLSEVLITPYLALEAAADTSKGLFNLRHSEARSAMTEAVCELWRRRFPIVRCLKLDLQNAIKVVEATAILHNISVLWGESMPPCGHPDQREEGEGEEREPASSSHQEVIVDISDLDKEEGQHQARKTRDTVRTRMDPQPSPEEQHRLTLLNDIKFFYV